MNTVPANLIVTMILEGSAKTKSNDRLLVWSLAFFRRSVSLLISLNTPLLLTTSRSIDPRKAFRISAPRGSTSFKCILRAGFRSVTLCYAEINTLTPHFRLQTCCVTLTCKLNYFFPCEVELSHAMNDMKWCCKICSGSNFNSVYRLKHVRRYCRRYCRSSLIIINSFSILNFWQVFR